MFGRYGWRSLSTDASSRRFLLPSGGGGNGNIYTNNKQLVLGTTYIATTDRSSRCGSAGRTPGRGESAGARREPIRSASPGCRPTRGFGRTAVAEHRRLRNRSVVR